MRRPALIFVFVLTLSLSIAFSDSFAQQITIDTNKESFDSGEIVMVSGSISQGKGGDLVALEIKNSQGDTILIRTVELDSNGGFDLTFKIPTSEEPGQYEILATAEIRGVKISETKTITQSQAGQTDSEITDGATGGCLIATATYGTELSPQVQQLRELRDNSLLQTSTGSSFVAGFNQIYYSFSPTIADWERENTVFKEAVKITITPLLTSLSLLNYVEMDSEAEVLGYGISLILLNIGMYFVAPAIVIVGIRKRF